MGYKLAGYTVVGNCEIDEDMEVIYKKNHHPKHTYLMDIRDFNRLGTYPDELKDLDILDGSPPCSVFSDAGAREKGWGTEKTFREGQKKQRLDDLFLHFIHTAEILKPKVIIAENVKGLVAGNAKGYVNEIIKAFKSAGYSVQIFLWMLRQWVFHREEKECSSLPGEMICIFQNWCWILGKNRFISEKSEVCMGFRLRNV